MNSIGVLSHWTTKQCTPTREAEASATFRAHAATKSIYPAHDSYLPRSSLSHCSFRELQKPALFAVPAVPRSSFRTAMRVPLRKPPKSSVATGPFTCRHRGIRTVVRSNGVPPGVPPHMSTGICSTRSRGPGASESARWCLSVSRESGKRPSSAQLRLHVGGKADRRR